MSVLRIKFLKPNTWPKIKEVPSAIESLEKEMSGIARKFTGGAYIPAGTKRPLQELRQFIKESPAEIGELAAKEIPGARFTTKGVSNFLKGLALGGGITLGGLGVSELASVTKEKTVDLFQERAFNEMLKINPKLQLLEKERVRLYFDTLWKFGPDLAKDPLIAGSVVLQAIHIGDHYGGPPIDQIKTIVEIQQKRQQAQKGQPGVLTDFLAEAGKKQIIGLY